MTFILRTRTAIAAVAMTLALTLGLAACTSGPNLTSPIGVWEAVGDDTGTLAINADGTFALTGASFDVIWYLDSRDFRGSGTWRLSSDGNQVILRFLEATSNGFSIEPTARRPDFTSGTIRFEDPEQTASIEFRLTD
ncbi:hypothetical protein [Zhihengliuella sp. ISTPL4]|uniref:hypothetical protein n=1 Tax=Zhihengliuella sp. ISTPL4 TaxID=2058657 RepID=UPI000C7E1045|nr:hypothetical protein [Zhihengliuella sp. ISTPL4]